MNTASMLADNSMEITTGYLSMCAQDFFFFFNSYNIVFTSKLTKHFLYTVHMFHKFLSVCRGLNCSYMMLDYRALLRTFQQRRRFYARKVIHAFVLEKMSKF